MEIVSLDDFERIYSVDVFEKEVTKLFSKSTADYYRYIDFLHSELHKISNRKETTNREEPITYKDATLYSIKKRMKKNTRVLYYYMKDDNIILLTAFDEKNKSDYDNGKVRAYNRLKNLNLL